ncbi:MULTISPECIES: hypothetical protein [unclassified Neorhizobium]|uniref:hypothetical protein n=1 Tax=unclassified Neorhizobium TaxID=2629175 RepID=UPI001FF4B55C|nr:MULTISPECIES: hypothetical protein [unclassified Neorhizobium]MCJ9669473.1 hypothetical protein [Neorhizobium sp. SHOUNA12B]MCJ9745503.1 hypothetical protein [Neorhizobium sp. SHOUNA12A]
MSKATRDVAFARPRSELVTTHPNYEDMGTSPVSNAVIKDQTCFSHRIRVRQTSILRCLRSKSLELGSRNQKDANFVVGRHFVETPPGIYWDKLSLLVTAMLQMRMVATQGSQMIEATLLPGE